MSTAICFAHSNLIDTSNLSGGSWSGSYSLDRLNTAIVGRALGMSIARTTDAAEASSIIDMDHGSAKAAQVLFIPAHNLTSAATIRLERGTTEGGNDVYAGTDLPAWPFTPLDNVYNGRHFGLTIVTPEATTARYTRIRIKDAANPAGYVQVVRPFIGQLFAPEYGPTKLTHDWMSLSTVDRTEGGADWIYRRAPLRAANLVYSALSTTEASQLHEIIRLHDTTSEVVYIAERNDRAFQQQYGFLALLRELSTLEYPWWTFQGIALGFDQRGGAPAA